MFFPCIPNDNKKIYFEIGNLLFVIFFLFSKVIVIVTFSTRLHISGIGPDSIKTYYKFIWHTWTTTMLFTLIIFEISIYVDWLLSSFVAWYIHRWLIRIAPEPWKVNTDYLYEISITLSFRIYRKNTD